MYHGNLYYERHGRGRPLILVHGGLGLDHSYFRPWLDPLGSELELISLDVRGSGRSAGDLASADHRSLAGDIEALRRELRLDRPLLLGHSYGGFLVLRYALDHPGRAAGLILANTSASMAHGAQAFALAEARATASQLQALQQLFAGPIAGDEAFSRLVEKIFPLYFAGYDERVGRPVFDRMRLRAEGWNHGQRWLADYDLREDLNRIDAPTLVMGGRHDWAFPQAHCADVLASRMPNAVLEVFEHSGHFPFIEEQERAVAVIRAWCVAVR